ncbi:hypothetical protein CC86DRAFT_79657 [Ophiobolus disseminans]|uniref:Uncharacterized protein n=1 Tax=Ophiobolus disseminans TaxID=1469910 RepID=A0A6A6ZN29_9PLEO|nr:hypothetical protein CC86DRAFT_79657 [Ophiobolus disseminans]
MAEADFFGLDELHNWIKEREYLHAVKTGIRMQIHPARFDEIPGVENHRFLHSHPPSEEALMKAGPIREYRDSHMLDAVLHHPSTDPQPTDDMELLQVFEIKVPSKGRYKCPEDYETHETPTDCEGICIPYGLMEVNDDPSDKGIKLDYEELPNSIVTVVKYREYRPEACMRDYEG